MVKNAPAVRGHGGEECGEMAATRQERNQLSVLRPHQCGVGTAPRRCQQSGNLLLLVGVLLISSCGIQSIMAATGEAEDGNCVGGQCKVELDGQNYKNVAEYGSQGQVGRRLLHTNCMGGASCSGHGSCAASGTLQQCVCEEGWNVTTNCSSPMSCTSLAGCSGRGICVKGGICACDPGWGGPSCAIADGILSCPRGCSGHGTCNQNTGKCQCDPLWDVSPSCRVKGCASNCTNGACVDGVCECNLGFSGPSCDNFACLNGCSGHGVCRPDEKRCDCSPWFTGEDCSFALCPFGCSGHGTCTDGNCMCDTGWDGYDCSFESCPQSCSGHGTCQVDGTCNCQTGYFGQACDVELCAIPDCSGHGSCQNATCICDSGWLGSGCENILVAFANFSCPGNCSSHGACVDGVCNCDYKWGGLDCSIEELCPNDCSQRGSCNNGTCACDFGWGGNDCGVLNPETWCQVNCTSGSGIFLNGTCLCLESGDGSVCPGNCSGHGACANSTCFCDAGYYGSDCSGVVEIEGPSGPACVSNCSGHGACYNGTCACDLGWAADDCSVESNVESGNCQNSCTGHGSCTENSVCICDVGYIGSDCSLSLIAAEPCAMNCSGHGACYNSTCWCRQGYTGAFCEMVGPGATPMPGMGIEATPIPWLGSTPAYSAPCQAGGCSGRGTCDTNTGICICDPGYSGSECETYLIAKCLNDCSNHGACLQVDASGSGMGDGSGGASGICICDLNWGGEDCSLPSSCGGHSTQLSANCSGHGMCLNGTCACENGWGGLDCSSVDCMNDCSGRGICANGTCACDFGWRGADCTSVSCANDCSGHGTCSSDHAVPRCLCDGVWTSSDCSMPLCPTTQAMRDPYVPCSGHGACTQNGTCICYNNFDGDDCDLLIDCSGRGIRKCGFCNCNAGFRGDNCEIDVCEDSRIYNQLEPNDYTKAQVCSGKGKCSTDKGCVCEQGAGKNCSIPSRCPQNCLGRGKCVGQNGLANDAGTCICDHYTIQDSPFTTPMYDGVACSNKLCPGTRMIGLAQVTCSGKGVCNPATKACDCFNVEGEGLYTGIDCGVPPNYFVSDLDPKVGPLEGGTSITVAGTGLERLLSKLTAAGKKMYCSFEGGQKAQVYAAPMPDAVVCTSPPVATSRTVQVTFVDNNENLVIAPERMNGRFEYFVQTNVMRVWPSYAPLRPNGDNGQNAPDLKRPNTITVTGDYFPPNGKYMCRFGDCDALPGRTRRLDRANLECEMPRLADPSVLPITVSSNLQQFSTSAGRVSELTVYGITGISPNCASQEGIATLTVTGKFLIDELDLTRNRNRFYCRFGTVTETGATKPDGVSPGEPEFFRFAFHSLAIPSRFTSGALECPVPDSTVETDYFGISLAADEFTPPGVVGDSFFNGQWDSNPSVRFGTYFPPAVLKETVSNPGEPYKFRMLPTLGGVAGGTRVTINGIRFDYTKNHPLSRQGRQCLARYAAGCAKPRCNAAPIPTCSFGMSATKEVEIIDSTTLVCISPVLVQRITQSIIVTVEVAMDGQTFTSSGLGFQYNPSATVSKVMPTAGIVSGGTPLIVYGTNFLDSGEAIVPGTIPKSQKVLKCVFISMSDNTIRYGVDAEFLGTMSVSCLTPRVQRPEKYRVDVTLSGQTDFLQLTGSIQQFLFYQDPIVDTLEEPIGTVQGGEIINVRGSFFVELQELVCRFGNTLSQAEFKSVNTIACLAPRVDRAMQVPLTVSMNGYDFSSTNITYVFYDLLTVHPSAGPAQGGTWMELTVDGGPAFRPDPAFEYHVKFGLRGNDRVVAGNMQSSSGGIAKLSFFIPRYTAYCDPTDTGCRVTPMSERVLVGADEYPARVSLAFTTKKRFANFPGMDFLFYDTQYNSVLPCTAGTCKTLSIPKDGKQYAVTFKGTGLVPFDGIKCAFYPIKSVTDLNNWDRWFSAKTSQESDFRTRITNPLNLIPPHSDVILVDGYYSAEESAVGCLAPGLDESGNKTYVGDVVTYTTDPAHLVSGYVATVGLNGQNFDHEVFQLLYLNPFKVHEIRSMSGEILTGGTSMSSAQLKVIGSHWKISDSIGFYKSPQVDAGVLVGGEYPNTLSCVFYAPMSPDGSHRFVDALKPYCNGTYCEAICMSPTYTAKEMDRGILYTQVFMSMNRRDPCMACGCKLVAIPDVGQILNPSDTKHSLLGNAQCVCSDPKCIHELKRDQGWDFHSPVSRFDQKTNSFCNNKQVSHVLFCGHGDGCHQQKTSTGAISQLKLHDCYPSLHFSKYTFFSPPIVHTVEPATIGQVNNQTLTVALSGSGFYGVEWKQYPDGIWSRPSTWCDNSVNADMNVKVDMLARVTYTDFATAHALLNDVEYNYCLDQIILKVHIPCAAESLRPVDSNDPMALTTTPLQELWTGCFRGPFKEPHFNQSKTELTVSFELSFNGVQFTPTGHSVKVFTTTKICPSDGCGHGTCLDTIMGDEPRCVCGIFENDQTCSREGRPNPTPDKWVDVSWGDPKVVKEDWMLGGSRDYAVEPATAFKFCPAQDTREGCSEGTAKETGSPFKRYVGSLNEKQPVLLTESVLKRGRTDLSCRNAPTVDYIWPTLGSTHGGTSITVDLNMWWYPKFSQTPWESFSIITDAANNGEDSAIACFFRDCGTSSRAFIQNLADGPVKGVLAKFNCSVPESAAGMTDVTMSFRNKRGDKSPLDFVGQFGFLFYDPAVVYNIRLMNGTTWERSKFADYISAPICKTCHPRTEESPEGRIISSCQPEVREADKQYPVGADCPHWKIFVNGTGFIDSDPLECQFALEDGSKAVFTVATFISSTVVECAIPAQAHGGWRDEDVYLKVTLDGQVYTPQLFKVDLYPQPTIVTLTVSNLDSNFKSVTTAGFGVDWRQSDSRLQTLFGVDEVHRESRNLPLSERLEKVPQYFRRAPTKGGTPLALFVADGCTVCDASRQLSAWKESIMIKFSPCSAPAGATSHEFLDHCNCEKGRVLPISKTNGQIDMTTQGSRTGGYSDRTVWKLLFRTPAMPETEAGDYMICLAVNGLHFTPLEEEDMQGSTTIQSLKRVGFSFYKNPILTSLGFNSGPIQIETSYVLDASGQNFLTDVITGPRYPHMVQVYLGGMDTAGANVPFSFKRANPQNVTVFDSNTLYFAVPNMSQAFIGNFRVNISISFNGYDFTQLELGVSEFLLYRIPEVQSIFPAFGHTDFDTIITIFGKNFESDPGRTKCKFEASGGRESVLVPATYISDSQMRCTIVPRLKGPADEFPVVVKAMSVKFTCDGTEGTLQGNPSLFKSLLVTAGQFRMFEDVPQLNLSATALPIEGGVEFPIAITQAEVGDVGNTCDEACGRELCLDFVAMTKVHPITKRNSLQIAIVPSSGSWGILRPAQYGDVIATDFELSPGVANLKQIIFVEGTFFQKWTCVTIFNLKSPVLPFPMLGSLKFSYNNGQKFVGPAATILFYRTLLPQGLAPARGSENSRPRPQVTSFFRRDVLSGASPPITSLQAKTAFKKAVGCDPSLVYTCAVEAPICRGVISDAPGCCKQEKVMICPTGPKCTFGSLVANVTSTELGFFDFGDELTLACNAPEMPSGSANVNISLDGLTFVSNPSHFYFYEPPKVFNVYPSNGLFDSNTKLQIKGRGFLKNDPGEVQLFCIFDFKNITPAEDRWSMPRFYSPARYIAWDKIECNTPFFSESARPSVPQYPRAQVGVVVDGRCNPPSTCLELQNVDSPLWSDGFFQYTDRPTVTRVVPSTGLAQKGNMIVTLFGTNFFRKSNYGRKSSWSGNPARGFTVENFQRLNQNWDQTVFGLTCRFGNSTSVVIDDNEVGNCGLPRMPCVQVRCPTPNILTPGINTYDVQVSLNAEEAEYSNPLSFTFNTPVVRGLVPHEGTSAGGGIISVSGDHFVDTACVDNNPSLAPCLQCRYTVESSGIQKRVPANFVNENLVTCVAPSSIEMGFKDGVPVESCGVGCFGSISIAVSSNGIEFTSPTEAGIYKYRAHIFFESFHPNAGPVQGNTTVVVSGRGFYPARVISCRFGNTVVRAKYISFQEMECLTPSWLIEPVQGGVFTGFTTNGVDFCELLPVIASEPNGALVCNFTNANPLLTRPFYYHKAMSVLDITPPSGIDTGGTEVHIKGAGFTNYGQSLSVYFGEGNYEVFVPANIINETHIRFTTPRLPEELNSANQDTAGEGKYYIRDKAYAMRVTSNAEQFTKMQVGQDCKPANPPVGNPQAQCTTEPFVMFTWYMNPAIFSVSKQVVNWYATLSSPLYQNIAGTPDIPQGPITGGTVVTISGESFTSLGRPRIDGGIGVQPQGCTGLYDTKPCYTTCNFPFIHAIQGSQYYYTCINLRRTSDQAVYNPDIYWCAVGESKTFANQYGICATNIARWKDFKQGGKFVTQLECRFGQIHVPATVIDNATITCNSPNVATGQPLEVPGIIVPLSVTMNRKDYTRIMGSTYFQYVKPAPKAVSAVVSNAMSSITVSFNGATNLQGLTNPNRVMTGPSPERSQCEGIFTQAFVETMGVQTYATCRWTPDHKSVVITLGQNANFKIGDIVIFKTRPCDFTGECWKQRTQTDLLITPVVPRTCNYPTIAGGCRQFYSQSNIWCGRCIPVVENAAIALIPAMDISYPFNQSTRTVRIESPVEAVVPTVVISGDKVVDNCKEVCFGGPNDGKPCSSPTTFCGAMGLCRVQLAVLSGESSFGHGGRPFTSILWGLDPAQTTDMSLKGNLTVGQGKLSARFFSGSKAETLQAGQNLTYCFTLTLTNWLGKTGTSSACYRVVQFIGKPSPSFQVEINARSTQLGYREVLLSENLIMTAAARASSCASNNSVHMNIKFDWQINPTPPGWDGVTTTSSRLTVPALTVNWVPSLHYKLKLTVTLIFPPGSSRLWTESAASQEYVIFYSKTQPIARVNGGSRVAGKMDHLVIDATRSIDPDVPEVSRHAETDLLFCWRCKHAFSGKSCDFGTAPTTPIWTIHNDKLQLSQEYEISVSVKAQAAGLSCSGISEGDPLTDTTSVVITIPDREDRPPVAYIVPLSSRYLDYSQPIRISGDVMTGNCLHGEVTSENCKVNYEWALYPRVIGFPDVTGNGYGRVSLRLDAFMLEKDASQEYTISLKVMGENGMIGLSAITVQVNIGPESGQFAVLPTTGAAMDTEFSLVANNWNDEHVPLTYEFKVTVSMQVCQPNCVIHGLNISLGGPQLGRFKDTTLPAGNPSNNDMLIVQATIYDALGSATTSLPFSVKVSFVPNVPVLVEKAISAFELALTRGDRSEASLQLSLFGGLLGLPSMLTPAMREGATLMRKELAELVDDFYGPARRRRGGATRKQRRLLAIGQASCDEDCVRQLGGNFNHLATSNPADLTVELCTPAFNILSTQLASANSFGADDITKKTNTDNILRIVAKCQQRITPQSYPAVRNVIDYVGVLLMKGKGIGDQESFELSYGVSEQYNFYAVFARLSSTRLAPMVVSAKTGVQQDLVEVYIPDSMRDYRGDSSFDFQVVLFGKFINPYYGISNTTLNSRMVRVNARTTDVAGTANANTVVNYPIDNLADPVRIYLDTYVPVSKADTLNKTSGAYRGSVCGTWNASSLQWMQFSTEFRSEASTIPCATHQLTSEFAVFTGIVGCDDKASSNPAVNNVCLKCNGGPPGPRQGICDFEGVPCLLADSIIEQTAKCPQLAGGSSVNACPADHPNCCLDKCHVCAGKNKKFTDAKLVNESGFCDFAGNLCPAGTSPTICGVCDVPANRNNRRVNAGICDCFDGGTPNGGKVLDRCSQCNGGNASMDYCGHNPHIPAEHVCHPSGPEGNPAWNASCSGCDGVPRPDLPWANVGQRWDVAPKQCARINSEWGRGGVQCDACDVCGGDSSTCVGCDGIPGSGKRLDICMICGGDNSACTGCDKVARYTPTQLDVCGDCGGKVYTACNSLVMPKYYCNITDYQPHYTYAGRDHVLTPSFNKAAYEENKNLCRQGCDGVISSGKTYNRCGICGASDNVCWPPCCEAGSTVPGCLNPGQYNCRSRDVWMTYTGCEYGVWQDACGKCGGDSSSCIGCDGIPFSGRVNDLCGECDGDGSSCIGCDGVVKSGKTRDSCGVCDGGDVNRDICGQCIFPPEVRGLSCSGCDGKAHSGKAVDACGECGGSNLCKWRDGDPPPESQGSTDAVVMDVPLGNS